DVADVYVQERGPAALSRNRICRLLAFVLHDVGDQHARAGGRQSPGVRPSHPPSSARHDGYFAREPFDHRRSLTLPEHQMDTTGGEGPLAKGSRGYTSSRGVSWRTLLTAAAIFSGVGYSNGSRAVLKGVCTSGAVTRRIGARRPAKPCSATMAA